MNELSSHQQNVVEQTEYLGRTLQRFGDDILKNAMLAEQRALKGDELAIPNAAAEAVGTMVTAISNAHLQQIVYGLLNLGYCEWKGQTS